MVAEKYIKVDDIIQAVKALNNESSIRISVVEAIEVVRGVWLDAGKNIHGQNLTNCSVCHSNSIEGGRFCRCCGALMKN